jgi:hypothetical protein
MVFDECYGEIPRSLHRAIRKYKVTPAQYYMLEDEFGATNFDTIEAWIKGNSPDGYFQERYW